VKCGFVALIGRPNAGKSTLLNRLVGTKLAIVSDKPQTTRNRILGVRNYPEGQVVFIDTPGIHRPKHRMNVRMVDAAVETFADVDVVGLVIDAAEPPGKGDRYLVGLLKDLETPVFAILNKIDLMKKPRLLPLIQHYNESGRFAEIVPVSAATGENVDRLERAMIERLPEGDPLYPPDYLTDQPERFFVAEIVREKVLQCTRAELPFSSAVIVDRFEEPAAGSSPGCPRRQPRWGGEERAAGFSPGGGEPAAGGVLRLFCTILVDRESQKPILVGRGGLMIKRIGSAARADLERFFGTRVFLDLRVRVKSEWREDERVLNELGLK
jgi:GTPase